MKQASAKMNETVMANARPSLLGTQSPPLIS